MVDILAKQDKKKRKARTEYLHSLISSGPSCHRVCERSPGASRTWTGTSQRQTQPENPHSAQHRLAYFYPWHNP